MIWALPLAPLPPSVTITQWVTVALPFGGSAEMPRGAERDCLSVLANRGYSLSVHPCPVCGYDGWYYSIRNQLSGIWVACSLTPSVDRTEYQAMITDGAGSLPGSICACARCETVVT